MKPASDIARKGFTLLELIVVMVLISLTVTFSIPKIQSGLYTDKLKASAQQLIGLVAEIGQEARSEKLPLEIRFDAEQHLFTAIPIGIDTFPDTSTEEKQVYPKALIDESVQVVDITSVHAGTFDTSSDKPTIRFTSRGYTDKTAIHLRSDSGEELTVLLSPFLGSARILEGYVSLDEDRITISR